MKKTITLICIAAFLSSAAAVESCHRKTPAPASPYRLPTQIVDFDTDSAICKADSNLRTQRQLLDEIEERDRAKQEKRPFIVVDDIMFLEQ